MLGNNLGEKDNCIEVTLCKISILDNFHLNLVVGRDFLEEKIREAAYAAAYYDKEMSHLFSLNDVYVNLGFQPCRSVTWAKRQEVLSPGIIRSVLKKSGFVSIQRSGGANVSRYFHNAPGEVRT